ncbi:DUF2062 domain-containing protein [Sansalvadorimonas verongulae]|uniref:DUF2062 domain-containing protein n=1 Tax=Sansalvadorimonas verongulae TaxID=2172824 RepID=UPI0018AD1E0F|nr:DUF2062 domain-containing protein [Sansalvadorimonas verongulae]MTI14878.1 DUF2062 domain-containing protein [Sansalvadorimonas verongulae]
MKTPISKRILSPVSALLQQGLGRQNLAMTLAIGFVVATFPIFGVTTFLCVIVAARMGLNQVAIQAANYAGYPLQFVLFVPLIRFGESVLGIPAVSVNPSVMGNMLWQHPLTFFQTYGLAVIGACVVWLMLAIPVIWLLQKLILQFIPARAEG